MCGEPDWIVEAALRRKRAELTQRWEEREAQLGKIRARERLMEEKGRGGKRARLDDGQKSGKGKRKNLDEEAEFLIDDWDGDGGLADDDPLSMLSKETRALLVKAGLGGARGMQEEEEDSEAEDEIKVCLTPSSAMSADSARRYTTPHAHIRN